MHLKQRLVVAALLLVWSGCAGSSPRVETPTSIEPSPPPPPPTRALASLIPSNAILVGRVEVSQLRQSPHYAYVEDWARLAGEEQVLPASGLLDMLGRTEEIWAALLVGGDTRVGGLWVARGRYGAEDLEMAHAATTDVVVGRHGAFEVSYRGDAALALIGRHTAIGGTREAVERALDLQESGTGEGPTDPVLASAMERVGFAQGTASLVLRVDPWLTQRLQLPEMVRASLESAGLALEIGEGMAVSANVRTTSSFVATALTTLLRSQLTEVRNASGLAPLGPLLDGARIERQQQDVWLRLALSAEQLTDFMERARAAADEHPRIEAVSPLIERAPPAATP